MDLNTQLEINQIKEEFTASFYVILEKYSQAEILMFEWKRAKAQLVIDGGVSYYITEKAKKLGLTPLQFASIIIQKSLEFEKEYTKLENERDDTIANIIKK